MAAHFTIDAKAKLIRVVFSGRVTVDEMYDGRRRMIADPAFDRTFSQLVDAQQVSTFEMNGYSVKQFAQAHVLIADARRAIVMTQSADLGLARMFQIYRDLAGGSESNQIFEDMDKAIDWLGLPANYPARKKLAAL